jgi:hypothetical protein
MNQKNKPNQTQTNLKRVGWGLYPTNSSCISRPIVLYFFLYNAVDEGPLRISRNAGQSVPSFAGSNMAIGGLEDRRMFGARNSNLLHRITIPLIICYLVTVVLSVHTAAALPGSGTQQDPYRIESLADFDEFAADPNYWAGFTCLETDVNLAGRTYTTAVIAPDTDNSDYLFQGTAFTGVFDGNEHKIVNLTIDGDAGNDFLGLFGLIDEGEVKNLRLEGAFVTGRYCVGGLVGYNGASISNCYSMGNVTGHWYVGGLVGSNRGSVSNCYSTGDVNGDWDVGGLVGWNYGSVLNCYSTGDVNGVESVGGLVGANGNLPHSVGAISNCYSTGDVNGHESVGGLVGYHTGSLSNCYSTGDVSGDYAVGGLVGQNGYCELRCFRGYIYNSYSTGSVQGDSLVGGLVGYNFCGAIQRSFWDVQTSGEPNMCGSQSGVATGCDPNCGKITAGMQTKSTFTDAGWDFIEIWLINEGATYPVLRQEIRSDLNGDGGVNFADFAIFADHWLEGKGD